MFTTFYDNMKAKVQKGYNTQVHYFNLLNAVISMFDWQGLPETIRPEVLESILSSGGALVRSWRLLRRGQGSVADGVSDNRDGNRS